jgi:hypothetical protein
MNGHGRLREISKMAEDYSKSLEAIFERIRSLFDHLGL